MRGICGWLGQGPMFTNPSLLLSHMADPMRLEEAAHTAVASRQGAAVGGVGAHTCVLDANGTLVALSGRPRIRNLNGLQAITRAVAEAYRNGGTSFLDKMRGPFSLAIVDPGRQVGLLAIDRLGIEPLSYALTDHGLVFATRADGVAKHPWGRGEIDSQSLYCFLYQHCVPAPRSIYRDQFKILPSELVEWRAGKVQKRRYWSLSYEPSRETQAALEARLLENLEAAVRDAAVGEAHAAFLSGGLDSSSVCGMLARIHNGPVDSYSIGFGTAGYDELEYARITASHFGLRAHEYTLKPEDVLETVPLLATIYDEPFANDSAVPTFHCAKLAANDGHSVMLAGDGGDEIFAGNARYVHQLLLEMYQHVPAILRRALIEPIVFNVPFGERAVPVRKLRSYIEQARVPLPNRLQAYNFLERTQLAEVLEPDFLELIDPHEPLRLAREEYDRARTSSSLNRILHLDLKTTLADNDLRKVSRTCEAAGIEVRYPMLDERLVEFAASVPATLKVKNFRLRHFFKHATRGFLPAAVIRKKKHGFGLPTGIWLRDIRALADFAHAALDRMSQRGIVRRTYVNQLHSQIRGPYANYYGLMLWTLIILEYWLRQREDAGAELNGHGQGPLARGRRG